MTTHDPFTRGSAVTILPGVPLDNVPSQRTESPAPQAQVPADPPAPAAPVYTPAPPAPAAPVYTPAPAAPVYTHAPTAPATPPTQAPIAPAGVAPQATAFPPATFPIPATAPVPPTDAAFPPAGPAYMPQAQVFPSAPIFAEDIPAAPAAFPIDVPAAPAAPFAAQMQASPFTPTPAPAFPPADAVSPVPVQAPPFQPALTQSVPLPELDVTADDKQSKPGKRRKEGSGVSPVKVAAIGAAVVGLAAGWFGHSALSGSNSDNGAGTPIITHAPVSHEVPLSSISTVGPEKVLTKPWVTTGQQALLSSSVVSSRTPVYFGVGGSHGTFADMGVSVGTLSTVAASRGTSFPAGPGGGRVNCGVNVIEKQAVSWCTWKDAKSSGMLTRFNTPTTTEAYRWTQLVRQTLEP